MMNWLDQLNRSLGRMSLGCGMVEWLHWAYDPFIVQGHEHLIGPGSVLVARPGVIHQIVNADAQGMELFWTCFP